MIVQINKITREVIPVCSLGEETKKYKYADVDFVFNPKKFYRLENDNIIEDVKKSEHFDVSSKIYKAKDYLSETDWYYARKVETGEDVPAEVSTKRVEAREFLRSKGY